MMNRDKLRQAAFWGLLLAVVTLIAYGPAWRAGFIWDDDAYVTDNPLLTAPDGLRRIWFSLDSPSQYFPLTYTSFYIERHIWGLNSTGYHLVNILLQSINAILLWRVLTRLAVPGAWLAAAIFALHPVQVESVAWITERKNLLMGFFFLLSIRQWLLFLDGTSARTFLNYLLALVFFALSLAAKTTACTLPAALLLILWLKKMPINWRRLAQMLPFVAVGIGMGLVTVWWEHYHQGTEGKLFEMGPVERVLLANRAGWFYLGKLIWPANLAFSYPLWTISRQDPWAWLWVAATAALGVVIWMARRWTGRSVETAALFYAATLCPMLGFIMLYTFEYSFVADHYQYLACVGPMALAAAGIELGLRRVNWGKFLRPATYGILLVTLGALTWRQSCAYASPETLWEATLDQNPRSWLAHDRLGMLEFISGDLDAALEHDKILLTLGEYQNIPAILPHIAEAHSNLAAVLSQKGDEAQALAEYQKALAIDPTQHQAHHNLAVIYAGHGQMERAVAEYRQALVSSRNRAKDLSYLGAALLQKGDLAEAITRLQEAVAINPAVVGGYNNLGIACVRQGKLPEAIADFRKALDVAPNDESARQNLERALERQKPARSNHP